MLRTDRRLLHYALVCAWTLLGLACPSDDNVKEDETPIDIPQGTGAVTIDVFVQVPEGDWNLRFRGVKQNEVESYEALSGSVAQGYALHCPEKLCDFHFTIRANSDSGQWQVAAVFHFVGDHSGDCDSASPNFPDDGVIERLFKVEYELSNVLRLQTAVPLPNDAGYSFGTDAGAPFRP